MCLSLSLYICIHIYIYIYITKHPYHIVRSEVIAGWIRGDKQIGWSGRHMN